MIVWLFKFSVWRARVARQDAVMFATEAELWQDIDADEQSRLVSLAQRAAKRVDLWQDTADKCLEQLCITSS